MRTTMAVRSSVACWGLLAMRSRASSFGLSPLNCRKRSRKPLVVLRSCHPVADHQHAVPRERWMGVRSGTAAPLCSSPAGRGGGGDAADRLALSQVGRGSPA